MTTYTYLAKDSSGDETKGSLDAGSLEAARESLVAKGLIPLEVYESVPSSLDELAMDRSSSDTPTGQSTEAVYFPFVDTLRLYAGWLLAWYCIVYAIGSYQFMKELPFRIPYAESLFLSPLVLTFTFAAYLFLILSGLYKKAGRDKKFGFVLLGLGIITFIWYRMNVQ